MKTILTDNAVEAWMLAKKYCECIADGLATISYQKQFVTFLHNATELFIKSAMLKKNDYRIMSKVPVDAQGDSARAYYSSGSINDYFKQLITKDPNALSSKYRSVDYHYLIDLQKKMFADYYDKSGADPKMIKNGLSALMKLRNNETHFYISPQGFLEETTFVQLHNFMIDFYKLLEGSSLLPFFGRPNSEHALMLVFDKKPLPDTFTYKQALLDSEKAKKVALSLKGMTPESDGDNAFEIAASMAEKHKKEGVSQDFYETAAYVQMMLDCKVLSIDRSVEGPFCAYFYTFEPGAFTV